MNGAGVVLAAREKAEVELQAKDMEWPLEGAGIVLLPRIGSGSSTANCNIILMVVLVSPNLLHQLFARPAQTSSHWMGCRCKSSKSRWNDRSRGSCRRCRSSSSSSSRRCRSSRSSRRSRNRKSSQSCRSRKSNNKMTKNIFWTPAKFIKFLYSSKTQNCRQKQI